VLHLAAYGALPNTAFHQVQAGLKPEKAPSTAMLGVICPKCWAKRAVTRNTIKRQIYAVSHDFVSQLPHACIVLRLSKGFAREQFKSATSPALKLAVRSEIQELISRLRDACASEKVA